MSVGIDALSFYTPGFYFSLKDLATVHQIDPDKYLFGIGQEKMSVPAPDEDIVTMAAEAAFPILTAGIRERISTVIFATESSVDQSKAAGLFLFNLLELPSHARFLEVKQACYSATGALQIACDVVRQRPETAVLILASDIARYDQGGTGECTQGAGAVAMLITASPRLIAFNPQSGVFSQDVMDFWRPNNRTTALVDGKLSVQAYETTICRALSAYLANGGPPLQDCNHFCFHLPYSKMAVKALLALKSAYPEMFDRLTMDCLSDGLNYGRVVGNTYTASLYISLLSLLETSQEDLSNQLIGLFSYGSGSVGEFFTGTVQPDYRAHLRSREHSEMLSRRQELDHPTYEGWFYKYHPHIDAEYEVPHLTTGRFRFRGIDSRRRLYIDALNK